MKLTKKTLMKLVEEVLNEQPPAPAAKPPAGGGEEDKPKKLKTDIPDSPFEPDVSKVVSILKKVLDRWKTKEYMSDKHRWQEYYKDILKVVKFLDGDDNGI